MGLNPGLRFQGVWGVLPRTFGGFSQKGGFGALNSTRKTGLPKGFGGSLWGLWGFALGSLGVLSRVFGGYLWGGWKFQWGLGLIGVGNRHWVPGALIVEMFGAMRF